MTKLKPLLIGLVGAGVLAASGYGLYNIGMQRGMGMAVGADRILTTWGCGVKLRLVYAVIPRLSRYSRGLSEPREILMRFSLYQRM